MLGVIITSYLLIKKSSFLYMYKSLTIYDFQKELLFFSIIFLILLRYIQKPDITREQTRNELILSDIMHKSDSSTLIILNTDRNDILTDKLTNLRGHEILKMRTEDYTDLNQLNCYLKNISNKINKCFIYNSGVFQFPELGLILKQYFQKFDTSYKSEREDIAVYHKQYNLSSNVSIIENSSFEKSDRYIYVGQYFRYINMKSKKVLILDSIVSYSPNISFPINKIRIKNPYFNFIIDFKNSEKNNQCFLVADHSRGNKFVERKYLPIYYYGNCSNDFSNAYFSFKMSNSILKNDKLIFYIWNEGGKEIYISKIRVEVY
jgi:hypothetical protein